MEEMDEYVLEALKYSLVFLVKDQDLPLEPSKLLANYMLAINRPRMNKIDIRKSSFKKIGKFLKQASKLGLVEYGKPKGGGGDHELVTRINR